MIGMVDILQLLAMRQREEAELAAQASGEERSAGTPEVWYTSLSSAI